MVIIEANSSTTSYWKEAAKSYEILLFLTWRDLLVRYKQAFFGVAWAILRPLLSTAIFAFVFGRVAALPSDGVNYSLFVLAALLPWQFFANAIHDSCNCLITNEPLITKVYFPRVILPLSQIGANGVDLLINLLLFFCLFGVLGTVSWKTVAFFPLFLLQTFFLATGLSLLLSALTVKYRDFRIIVPFLIQFGLFISPVGYGSFLLPEKWQFLFFLNPLVGIIEGLRWALFGISHVKLPLAIGMSIVMTAIFFFLGTVVFRKMERTFADRI